MFGQFDIVIEHTFFCAIHPRQRNEVVQLWKKLLAHGGCVYAVLFTMQKRHAPPFGSSEWELRERFKKDFQVLMWNRWKHSIERREGKELFVYMRKKD